MNNDAPTEAHAKALVVAYAALNRNDITGFVKDFDSNVERIEPSDFPQAGTYNGIEAVTAHVTKGRGSWAEGCCEPQMYMVSGNKIIMLIQVRARLKTETTWREGQTADAFTFRDGKIVQFRTFFDAQQALDWAGANQKNWLPLP
ncbi:MAG: nuclear transport factor 2 family protein [Planctomycetes bacterium]|nr:nuclear transport factor 2 family protein [Planctomycetota bacterium]